MGRGESAEYAEDESIRWELVKSLGSLRGIRPADVDAFLRAADAPTDLVDEIGAYSQRKPVDQVYLRFYQLLSDVLAYAPTSFVKQLIVVLENAFRATSLGETVAILVDRLIELAVHGATDEVSNP